MTRGRNARVSAAIMLVFALLAPRPAAAAEFHCIEASRYGNILQIFNDDAQVFATYFGLEKRAGLTPSACRALLVTGTLQEGDGAKLLDEIAANNGWLAVLYLAARGAVPSEEGLIAQAVRQFALQTRIVTTPRFRYEPDFATRIITFSRASAEAETAQAVGMSSLDNGLRDFSRRKDAEVIVPGETSCLESCIAVWAGGVHRPGPRLTPPTEVSPLERRRAALVLGMDGGKPPDRPSDRSPDRPPAARDPVLAPRTVVPGGLSLLAPAQARSLREACGMEVAAVEAIATRIGEATADLARRDFKAFRLDALAQQFVSARRAGLRLQQCLAGAAERERLASFRRMCAETCDRGQLRAAFAKAAEDLVRNAGAN